MCMILPLQTVFIILICAHSLQDEIPDPKECPYWNDFVIEVIKNGSLALVYPEFRDKINIKCIYEKFLSLKYREM